MLLVPLLVASPDFIFPSIFTKDSVSSWFTALIKPKAPFTNIFVLASAEFSGLLVVDIVTELLAFNSDVSSIVILLFVVPLATLTASPPLFAAGSLLSSTCLFSGLPLASFSLGFGVKLPRVDAELDNLFVFSCFRFISFVEIIFEFIRFISDFVFPINTAAATLIFFVLSTELESDTEA